MRSTMTIRKRFSLLLHKGGFRATPGRLSLLSVLANAKRPMSIPSILKEVGRELNQATVYRALEALADAGIVRRVDMGHGHADYELVEGERHHHHLICKRCGVVENINGCDAQEMEKMVLRASRKFTEISHHSLEFFGICTACARMT